VNTHLEAFSAFIRKAQASELVFAGGPTTSNLPVILVGDLNSDPDDPSISPSPPEPIATPNAAAYGLIAGDAYNEGAGFVDRGVTVNTCCHDADLLNPVASFDSRIDHVLTNAPGRIKKISAKLIGADPAFRTPTGLWPSDHGGVVARLRVR
jgi:endonuclease/exonuclease/phosphatase family metal-dependent hydrolase